MKINQPLTYLGYELQSGVENTSDKTTISYTTIFEGNQELRAQYKVHREVWDTLEVIMGVAHGLQNLHFSGYWVSPSNQELIDRVVKGWKPSGSVIYSDAETSPEQTTEMAWLNSRVINPSIDRQVEVFKVDTREGYTKFLIGSTQTMAELLNWSAFVELAHIQGWEVSSHWGALKPLELLRINGAEFEFPSNNKGFWGTGLALGYHPATTMSLNDGSFYLPYLE
jgi:hypothetical protein